MCGRRRSGLHPSRRQPCPVNQGPVMIPKPRRLSETERRGSISQGKIARALILPCRRMNNHKQGRTNANSEIRKVRSFRHIWPGSNLGHCHETKRTRSIEHALLAILLKATTSGAVRSAQRVARGSACLHLHLPAHLLRKTKSNEAHAAQSGELLSYQIHRHL